jgi:hypothetical protein
MCVDGTAVGRCFIHWNLEVAFGVTSVRFERDAGVPPPANEQTFYALMCSSESGHEPTLMGDLNWMVSDKFLPRSSISEGSEGKGRGVCAIAATAAAALRVRITALVRFCLRCGTRRSACSVGMWRSAHPHAGYGIATLSSTTPILHSDVRGVPLVLR